MKTNQIMTRPMGVFSVEQRTKDSMFNATALLKQYNESTGSSKELKKFFENDNTKMFIETLVKEENLHGENFAYVKSKARSDRGGGTWMHPILFVKFAMWLNPHFEVQVIKFVYDQMLQFRNDAGDAYRELGSAVSTLVPKNDLGHAMRKVGEALNWVIFNCHEKMLRNKHGDESKLREMWQLEKKVADLVNEGFIRSFDALMNYLRTIYAKRHTPQIFSKQ